MRLSAKTMIAMVLLFGLQIAAAAAAAGGAEPAVNIRIDIIKNRLSVLMDGTPIKTYPIALGKPQTPSPIGEWKVVNKYKNWAPWFGTRWIGLNVPWGMYGIHGTNKPASIGHDASHGCVRMLNRHVEELYELVRIGTAVSIIGHPLGEPHKEPRRLAKGDTGADVMLIQFQLKAAGWFDGLCNGKFGPATEQAIKRFERHHGFPVDGVVTVREYLALGLLE